MSPLLKKLNYKDQKEVLLINLPADLQHIAVDFGLTAKVVTDVTKTGKVQFMMAFCTKQNEVDKVATEVLPKVEGDGVVWFAYPKGTSKRYRCEFNRDNGWKAVGQKGFEGVRMVAVDDNWSALRFRKVQHIKTMIRSFAMTDEGKAKAAKKK